MMKPRTSRMKAGIEHLVERHRADDGHGQRRHGGDDREKRDDTNMQPGRGRFRAPGADQQERLVGHQRQQHQHDAEIDQEEDRDGLVGRIDRRQAGENQKGRDGAEDGEGHDERPHAGEQSALAATRFLAVELFVGRQIHSARFCPDDCVRSRQIPREFLRRTIDSGGEGQLQYCNAVAGLRQKWGDFGGGRLT